MMTIDGKNTDLSVVFFCQDFYPSTSGGAHEQWLLAQQAVELGARVTVFTTRDDDTARSETENGVKIVRPASTTPSFAPEYSNLSIPFRIVSSFVILLYSVPLFARTDVDGIYSASYSFHWMAKVLSVLFGIPLTTFIAYSPSARNKSLWSVRRLLEWVNFKLFMGSVVCCRSPAVREAAEKAGHNDVRIVHGILNSEKVNKMQDVDADEVRSQYGFSEEQIVIAFVGRFVPIKQPTVAVKIIRQLPESYHLLMIGDGPQHELTQGLVEEYNVSSRVTLPGLLSHEEALKAIKSSDIQLVTSETEAYPTVVFEALALGSEVVAPPVGILPEIDHPRLHLVAVENQHKVLQQLSRNEPQVCSNDVQRYALRRFTEEIIGHIRDVAE